MGYYIQYTLSKLRILQKRAIRLITNSKCDSPSLPIFVKLKILPILELIKLNITFYVQISLWTVTKIIYEYV